MWHGNSLTEGFSLVNQFQPKSIPDFRQNHSMFSAKELPLPLKIAL